MSKIERMRDALASPPEPGYWEQRRSAGWRLASIEWEREASGEEEPVEMQALTLMMNSIVDSPEAAHLGPGHPCFRCCRG